MNDQEVMSLVNRRKQDNNGNYYFGKNMKCYEVNLANVAI